MWNAIGLVSGGFSLAAFIVAVGYWAYRRRLIATERQVQSAPESSRPRVIEDFLSTVHVDTSGLSRDQRYRLALEILATRVRESRQRAALVAFLGLILGAITAIALWPRSANQGISGTSPTMPKMTESPPESTPKLPEKSLVPDKPARTAEDALYDVFDFAAYQPDWRGAARADGCRERWEWRVELGSREITSNLTRLNFNFTCHRRSFCYDCGGGWDCVSPWPLHDWPGRVTADLKVEGDVVIVSNVQSPENKFGAECETELMELVKAKNGAKFRG